MPIMSKLRIFKYDYITAEGLAYYFSVKIKNNFTINQVTYPVIKRVISENNYIFKGLLVIYSGRFTKKQRATYKKIRIGKTPFNTLLSNLDYGSNEMILKYSICNVKVYLNFDLANKYKKYIN